MDGYKDRSQRLFLLGLLALALGACCVLLAGTTLLLPTLDRFAPDPEAIQVDARSIGIQVFLFLSAGAAFALLGWGSMRCARWVRPLMLIYAWTWLLTGIATMAFLLLMLDPLIEAASDKPLPPEIQLFVKAFLLTVMAVAWLVLPVLFIWGYTSRQVARTCAERNPEPAWTDRCPISVLGLSLGLAAGAYFAPASAVYAVLPLFGWMSEGVAAVVLTLAGAALCAYLAWATYRLRGDGFWGSVALFVLLGVSVGMTLLRVGVLDLYAAFGYPEQQLAALRPISAALTRWSVVLTALMTVAGLGYMGSIHKHFVSMKGTVEP